MLKLLITYKKRLTNLTSKNRSLLLLRPILRQFIDLRELDLIKGGSILNDLISSKKRIELCERLDPRDGKTNVISQHLRKIWKTDTLLKEERGAEDLYVGYPFITGKLVDGTLVRCPLLFFPVDLQIKDNKWFLEKRDAAVSLNKTFLLAYSQFNKTFIDEEFFNHSFEDFSHEPLVFLTELYEFLKNSKLEINFNSELFTESLKAFESIRQEDLEATKIGEIKLEPHAVLGIFPQTGSYIAADYDQLISDGLAKFQGAVEDYLFKDAPLKERIREQDLHLPFPVDASQEEAIRQIKSGKSLVIQGPPGTGKSQLICNLMADYAADGKKVLLICQKRAAIDTVYNRLKEIGMDKFSAIVHDFQSDRGLLYKKITSQVDNILPYKHLNQSLNAIFLEREFDASCRKIDHLVKELESYKTALFDTSTYGKSVKELYLMAEHQTEKELDLSDCYSFFHFDTLDNFTFKLESLEKYQRIFYEETEAYSFWQNRKPFAGLSFNELELINKSLTQIVKTKKGLKGLGEVFSLEVSSEIDLIKNYLEHFNSERAFIHLHRASQEHEHKDQLGAFIDEVSKLKTISIAKELKSVEKITEIRNFTQNANLASSNVFSRFIWNTFSKDKQTAFNYLQEFGFEPDPRNFEELIQHLNNFIRLNDIAQEIGQEKEYFDAEELKDELEFQKSCHLFFKSLESITKRNLELKDKGSFETEIKTWASLLDIIDANKETWQKYISLSQINDINFKNHKEIKNYLDLHFENLCARDKLFAELTAVEKKCYLLCKEHFKEDYTFHFKQCLFIHFIEDLEKKSPILRSVSSLEMELWTEELQGLILKKQQYSNEYLLIKLRENTYKNIEKNRLGNYTTYRELYHQTTKKRQIWPVRKLLSHFKNELFDLVPCWMASPETVSAIFPLFAKEQFDLIIYDEASQCFAEKGIPGMLRGKQVVIAGDSKQLQPSDLYRIKIDEENEDDAILESESLLDFAAHFLPQTILRGHYRSKSLDLIDFSNKHFYENKLKLLPNFLELNDGNSAIDFIKVPGVWQNNQNLIEANKVLELVEGIREYSQTKSIGVVTFNFLQADLIQDLTQKVKNLTVKNIENIQGDEFDIVIFSIGYAPNTAGKLLMNFGSLNQQGGENRLNVAITRAREKIKIVCSISPDELKVENSSNNGPKLLKAYLQYVQEVSNGSFKPSLPVYPNTSWTRMLKNEIINANKDFVSELPFADLSLIHDEKHEKLILTDDEQFYSAESIKESFAYHPIMLAHKGWFYQKVWSRNWWVRPLPQLHLLEEKREMPQH